MSETQAAPPPEAAAALPPPPPEPPRQPERPAEPWRDSRIDNITRARREAETARDTERQRAETAEQRLAQVMRFLPEDHEARRAPQTSPQELERMAEARGAEKAAKQFEESRRVEGFVAQCNDLAQAVVKEFGDAEFGSAADGWRKAGLDLPDPTRGVAGNRDHQELLGLVMGIDGGAKVFRDIGKDPDFAAYLLDPSTPRLQAAFALAQRLPRQQAAELVAEAVADEGATQQQAVEAAQAAATAAPPPAPGSITPSPPVAPKKPANSSAPRPPSQPAASRGSSAASSDLYDPGLSTEEFARIRSEQRRARRGG